jgi:hypothetical protein
VLQYVSTNLSSSAFPTNFVSTGGSGAVSIQSAIEGNTVSGSQIIGSVTFNVLGSSGSSAMTFANSCAIVDSVSHDNIWNTITTGGTYSIGSTAGSAPANTVLPAISGTATVGDVLAGSTGTWTSGTSITYTYQWNGDGSPISGATSSSYTLQQGDQGDTITVTVTATNSTGPSSATSMATAAVAASSGGVLDFNTSQPIGPSGSWTLDFSDDFTGSSLNATYWGDTRASVDNVGNGQPFNPGGEWDWYDPSAVTVADSCVTLTLTAQSDMQNIGGTEYTLPYKSGVIATGPTGSAKYSYGPGTYIESVIYVPSGTGLWPAFWAICATGWPNWHYQSGQNVDQTNPDHNTYGTGNVTDGFHNYGMYWTSGETLEFYVDGTLYAGANISGVTDQQMIIIYNLATQDQTGTTTGLSMSIDWVRVWT